MARPCNAPAAPTVYSCMRRLFHLTLLAGSLVLGVAVGVQAQPAPDGPPILLEADDTPLAELLLLLAEQTGVDVVFAERTVAGKAVRGRYIGRDVEGALRTVLRGSGLRAQRVRPRQYVIVPTAPAPPTEPEPLRETLRGTVVDAETGEVLPGAHVVLAGLGLGTVTNAVGYFAVPDLPAGTYRVRFSFVGYRAATLEIPVYPESKLEAPAVRLRAEAVLAEGVMVEGSDGERSDLEAIPGVAAVGPQQAAAMPGVLGEGDALGALAWLPGVLRSGEAGGELVVRGAPAPYNRYLLDGAPVLQPWHAFGLFSAFQPEALKSTRLYRGSLPAEFGGALSAVLDMEMRDGEREGANGIIAVSPLAIRGVAEVPVGPRLSLMLTGRRTWLGALIEPRLQLGAGAPALGFAAPGLASERTAGEPVEFGFSDLGVKGTWRVARGQRLSLSVYGGGDDLAARLPLPDGPPGDSLALGYGWGNRVVSVRHRALLGRRLFVSTTGYHSRYRAAERAATPTLGSDHRLHFAESGLRLDADYYAALGHQLRAGLRLIHRDFERALTETALASGDARPGREAVQAVDVAGYVQDTWQPAAGWQLQPGLRIELYGLGGHLRLSPRLHLRRDLVRNRLFLRAGLSQQTQPVHHVQRRPGRSALGGLIGERWVLASEGVRPASAWQGAAGLEWHPRAGLALGAEVYGRRLSDLLLPLGEGERVVVGEGRAFGVETSAAAERGRWRLGLAYTYGRALERRSGGSFGAARYDAPHQLQTSLLGGGRRWSLALGAVVRSGYPDGDGARLPVYARLDLAVGYRFRLVGLAWDAQAQAYNLLNRRNVVGLDPEAAAFAAEAVGVEGLPMLPMLNLRVRW